MIRAFHRWPGLLALALLVTVLSLSGAALSVFPAAERIAAPQAEAGLTVAALADRIQAVYPGVEQIRRVALRSDHRLLVRSGHAGRRRDRPGDGRGRGLGRPEPDRTLADQPAPVAVPRRWRAHGHGRGGAAMLVLSLSGAALVARRAGGWRHWFAPLRGPLAGRLHVEIARIAVVGLVLSSTTALWMTASTFDLLPDGGACRPPRPRSAGRRASLRARCPRCSRRPSPSCAS
jgi:sulfite reductase (NADPH) flavoprotein alpha-component